MVDVVTEVKTLVKMAETAEEAAVKVKVAKTPVEVDMLPVLVKEAEYWVKTVK